MSITCTFHRSKPAHFQCHECGSAFCEECISLRDTTGFSGKNRDYFCPGCNIPAEMVSLSNIIPSFWTELTSFFLFPIQVIPLLLILVLAGLGTIFPESFLVRLFVFVVMMKYAYATLIHTAQGGHKAVPVTWELINSDVLQVFKQYVVFGLIGFFAAMIFGKFGMIAGFGFVILMILAMPAIIMLLVATNSVFQALNPVTFIGVMSRIGWPYFLMYLFLAFLLAGPAALFTYLPHGIIPMKLLIFIMLFLEQYYMLICYRLMGYVLLQYHKELGYHVDYEFFVKQRGGKVKKKKPQDELDRSLAILIKLGKYEEALKQLQPHVLEGEPTVELSEKFLQLLKMAGKTEGAARFGYRHLELLVQKKKKQKALTLFSELEESEENVVSAEAIFQLGRWYKEQKEFKKAISSYIYFIKKHKKHILQPKVYFELAKLLHEQGNNSTKARQLLMAILTSNPQHEVAPKAEKYLEIIGEVPA